MVVGVIGANLTSVPYLVEAQTKADIVNVTILLPNSAVKIVLVILLKPKDATKIRVQLMEVLAIGTSGMLAQPNVEVEIKQE
jgi:hypothetical protein